MKSKYSTNELAAKIVGFRDPTGSTIPLDQPCELGFHCPVCKYELIVDSEYDERLVWSEYNTFLYCHVCNKDYPSVLCTTDIEHATHIYLTAVEQFKNGETNNIGTRIYNRIKDLKNNNNK